jgi:hypothetical protein
MREQEHLDQLRREFAAEEGTFLLHLRGDRIEWDRAAFSRWRRPCGGPASASATMHSWTAGWSTGSTKSPASSATGLHTPAFPEPTQYYNECIQRLDDLADWFFRGYHGYIEPYQWHDL